MVRPGPVIPASLVSVRFQVTSSFQTALFLAILQSSHYTKASGITEVQHRALIVVLQIGHLHARMRFGAEYCPRYPPHLCLHRN